MNINSFMELSDRQKKDYMQKCYPGENGNYDSEYDFGVFEGMECEICDSGVKHPVVYGTSDSREPKFCPKHFVEISQETEFVKWEEI